MMRSRDALIRALVEDLRPAPRLRGARLVSWVWLFACTAFVAGATLATGPLRPGAVQQLEAEPRLLLELLVGFLASAAAIRAVLRLRVPDLVPVARRAAPALLLFLAWVSLQLFAWVGAAGEPSMLGKRELCRVQILLFSVPPLAAALFVARRAAPFERAWTGALAGAAAGALPALAMQLACMDEPFHALIAHLAPVFVLAGVGALLGRVALRRL